ncbi:hypothetical protein [Sulfurimonas sp.]|jgi:hypothetical protein|uniref:hypothetical protein n=1 Tax=Sulfurimonas sp. TaxID=2022749 RepID=UPI0025D24298|nr:hypothetical protein [Sulfurimonas sp.]MBT5935107.1 hypothetical protein [Sulfurimonas sp.]
MNIQVQGPFAAYTGTLSETIVFEYDDFSRVKNIGYAETTEENSYDADGLLIKKGNLECPL